MRGSRSKRATDAAGVVAAAAVIVVAGAGTASADTPWVNALGQATEKIQFYTAGGAQSWWNYSNGVSRLYNCHNT